MRADNSTHLTVAAQRRSQQVRRRAEQALQAMTLTGQPLTMRALARTAGVSRSWLYTQPDIRDAVASSTTRRLVPHNEPRASGTSLHRRLEIAHNRNRELTAEIKALRDQLTRIHGELRATRHRRYEPGLVGEQ